MAINNLHKTKAVDNLPDFLSGLTTREISINGIDATSVEAKCSNYPFDGQTLYSGTIRYKEQPEYGRGRDLDFGFEARTESGLLIIRSDVDAAIDNILGQVNSATDSDFRIYRRLSPHREALWNFIRKADSVVEVTVVNDAGDEVSLDETEEDLQSVIGKYPIEDATFSYQYQGENILVKYTAGSLQIDAENSEATEYIIQIFERDIIGNPTDSSGD